MPNLEGRTRGMAETRTKHVRRNWGTPLGEPRLIRRRGFLDDAKLSSRIIIFRSIKPSSIPYLLTVILCHHNDALFTKHDQQDHHRQQQGKQE